MLKKIKKRVETGALVTALVVPLGLCVFAFLGLAGYFAFREHFPPDLAALVTAACGIVLIALIFLIARISDAGSSSSSRAGARRDHDAALGDDLESFLREHGDPIVGDWVRKNPDRAVVTTLILGVAAGYSGRLRRVLLDMYARYAESENLRRARRRE